MKLAQKITILLMICFSLFLLGQFLFGDKTIITFSPGIAHAQNLHADLSYPGNAQTAWLFDIWKISLGLANVVVVLILIALAVVNILHINYDTFAIKKSLPLLILGIIMSYFSLFICRMIVDAAQVLINTFAGDTHTLAQNYMCSMALNFNTGTFADSILQLNSLIIILIFGVLITIGILIISFLLLVRKFVIFILVAIAPVAFILYAFPPTQGLFKQWWTQFVRWVFMGPAIMFLIWVASMIGATNCQIDPATGQSHFSVSALLAVVGLTYLCAIVPFKLGGGIMGAWGKAASWATGTGKEGFMRKPVDKWWGDSKQMYKDKANAFMNKRTPLGYMRAGREIKLEQAKGMREATIKARRAEVRKRKGASLQLVDMEIAEATQLEDAEKAAQALVIKEGKFNHISKIRLRLITGKSNPADVAQKYVETANRLRNAQDAIAKRDALDVEAISAQELRRANQLDEDTKKFGKIESAEFGQDGSKLKTGKKIEVDYVRAVEIGEELRYKAKTATGEKREELLAAAAHFDKKATEFRAKNKEITAKDPTSGKTVTREIKYDQDYLGRNERGRRRAIVNRATADDVQTEQMGNTAIDLIEQTQELDNQGKPNNSFGSSETQATFQHFNTAVNGNWHQIDPIAARACQTFLRATVSHLEKAQSGDLVAVRGLDKFCTRMEQAERKDFKQEKIDETLSLMAPERQSSIKGEMIRQRQVRDGTFKPEEWSKLTPQLKVAKYEELAREYDKENASTDPADQAKIKELKQKVDFTQMPVTGTSAHEKANRDFMGAFVERISMDGKMKISKSPHSAIGRVTEAKEEQEPESA